MGKAERTRQFIIEQAAPVFNEKGIAGTTIDDILAATKMAKGGLYGHFESKEEMSYVMVDFLLDQLGSRVNYLISREKTAFKKLVAFMEFYKNPMTSYLDGGCPILNFGVEADDTNPVVKQKVKLVIETILKNMTAIVNQGIADQEFSDGIDAAGLSLKIFVSLEGAMMVSRVIGSNKHMDGVVTMLKTELKSYLL